MIDYEMIAAREAMAQTALAAMDVQASYMAIYLTMIFAYISLAYLAGKDLTRFQLAIVTFIFVAAAGRQVGLIASAGMAIRIKSAQIIEIYEQSPVDSIAGVSGLSIWWPIAIWSAGIIASLIFMWGVRYQKVK